MTETLDEFRYGGRYENRATAKPVVALGQGAGLAASSTTPQIIPPLAEKSFEIVNFDLTVPVYNQHLTVQDFWTL